MPFSYIPPVGTTSENKFLIFRTTFYMIYIPHQLNKDVKKHNILYNNNHGYSIKARCFLV